MCYCTVLCGASEFVELHANSNRKQRFESVVLQEREFGSDTARLKEYLQPILENAKRDEDSEMFVMYYGMLANGYGTAYDRVNSKSNLLHRKAITIATQKEHKEARIWALINYGYYLYHFRDMASALPIFMQAVEAIQTVPIDKLYVPCESLKKVGFFFGTIGDNEEAIRFLKMAQSQITHESSELAAILDNLGLYALNAKDTIAAEQYFNQAIALSKKIHDEVRLGKALGNMALILQNKGKVDEAIQFVKEDIGYSELHQSDQNTMYALILIARLYLQKGDVLAAQQAVIKAQKYAVTKSYFKSSEFEIMELKLNIALLQKDETGELVARRRMSVLGDSLKFSDGDLMLKQTKLLAQKERYTHKIELERQRYEKERFKNWAYLGLVIILIFIIFLIFNTFQRKIKVKQHNYEKMILKLKVEQMESHQKLLRANETMDSYRSYLAEKNEQIDRLNQEIQQIGVSDSPYLSTHKGQLQSLLDSHLMTDENWEAFKVAFEKEHADFLEQLLSDYPELTESHKRIVLLLKLGLSNKEMSNLLGVTVDAIKKSRQRLRKKLGVKSEELFNIVFDKTNTDNA